MIISILVDKYMGITTKVKIITGIALPAAQ